MLRVETLFVVLVAACFGMSCLDATTQQPAVEHLVTLLDLPVNRLKVDVFTDVLGRPLRGLAATEDLAMGESC